MVPNRKKGDKKIMSWLRLTWAVQYRLDELIEELNLLKVQKGKEIPEVNEALKEIRSFHGYLDQLEDLKEVLEEE